MAHRTAFALIFVVISSILLIWQIEAEKVPCFCNELPSGQIDAPVTIVPASAKWLSFEQNFNLTTQTRSFLFVSSSLTCFIEAKVERVRSTVPLVFLRSGHGPFNRSADVVGTVSNVDCCDSGNVFLGQSVVSKARTLALVVVQQSMTNITKQYASFKLLLRQRCGVGSIPGSSDAGFEVFAKTSTAVDFEFDSASTMNSFEYVGATSVVRAWSLIPPPNCSVAFQVTRMHGAAGLDVLGYERISATNTAYVVRTQTASSPRVEATWSYRTICDGVHRLEESNRIAPGMSIQTVNYEWQTTALDVQNVSNGQLLVWRLTPPDNTSVILEPVILPGTNLSHTISFDFRTVFRLLSADSPLPTGGRYFGIRLTKPGENGRFIFRFRAYRPAGKAIIVVSDASTWTNFTGDDVNGLTRLELTAVSAENCVIRIELLEFLGIPRTWLAPYVYPFGLRPSNLTHSGYSAPYQEGVRLTQYWTALSHGHSMGMSVLVYRAPFSYTIRYKLQCLAKLPEPAADWRRVTIHPDSSAFLPAPPAGCKVDFVVSAWLAGGGEVAERAARLTCVDQTWTVIPGRRVITESKCTKALIIHGTHTQKVELSYRLHCRGEKVPLLFPYPVAGALLTATDAWKSFTHDTGLKTYKNFAGLRAWTIRPVDPACTVEVNIPYVDVGHYQLTEDHDDLATDDDYTGHGNAIVAPDTAPQRVADVPYHLSYLSCTNNVYIQTVYFEWKSQREAQWNAFKAQYRQRCRNRAASVESTPSSSQTCQLLTVLTASKEWQSVDFQPRNFIQVQESKFVISSADALNASTAASIEVEFLSVIQQSFLMARGPRGPYQEADGRGVYIEGKAAAVARSFVFVRPNVTITSNVIIKRGDHVFRARYRLRNTVQAVLEQVEGHVLFASNKSQVLELRVPRQFSSKRREYALTHELEDFYEDDYEEGYGDKGKIDIWMYRFLWTIKPLGGTKCRVVLRFTKIDIGYGHVGRGYVNDQHRLSVHQTANTVDNYTSRDSFPLFGNCASLKNDANISTFASVCARLDQAYTTNLKGASIRVEFKSSMMASEYENEAYGPNLWTSTGTEIQDGAESTWGSGWRAVYYQDCSASTSSEVSLRETSPARAVKATSAWSTRLPAFPQEKNLAFILRTWTITPVRDGCTVDLVFDCPDPGHKPSRKHCKNVPYYEIPIAIIDDTGRRLKFDPYGDSWHYSARNFKLVLFGKRPDFAIHVKYRQVCTTATPSIVPSRPPTLHPTSQPTLRPSEPHPALADGWSCANDARCLSGTCSLALNMCMSSTCQAVCKSKQESEQCESFATVGCACVWNEGSAAKKCSAIV